MPHSNRVRRPLRSSIREAHASATGVGAVFGARSGSILSRLALLAAVLLLPAAVEAQSWESAIVFEGADGRLQYVADDEGNRIPDFSHAGYRGGGVALPAVTAVVTVEPGDDDSARIQAAIDSVSGLPREGGFRGAVLLAPGVYTVDQPLRIRTSGVVLRGAGSGTDEQSNSIMRRTGTSTQPVIEVGSGDTNAWREERGTRTNVTTDFVPVGARALEIADAHVFEKGDQVVIVHPLSSAWIEAVDGGGTFGSAEWRPGQFSIVFTRRIEAIHGDELRLDAPVYNHLDRSLTQAYVFRRDRSGVIDEVGVEDLRIEIQSAGATAEDHALDGVRLMNVENGWVRNVTALHFVFAGVRVSRSLQVTVRDSKALEPHSLITGTRRYNFAVERSQLVLFDRNLATEGRHSYVGNGTGYDNGIVFLRNVSRDAYAPSEVHRQWGQAFLYDNHVEENPPLVARRIHLGNRGNYGTSHGWAAAHSVAWNCRMNGSMVVIEKPPTAQNYAIGCSNYVSGTAGPFDVPPGYIEGTDREGLTPESLYDRQLADRMSGTAIEDPSDVAPDPPHSYPNPASLRTTLVFSLSTSGFVTVELYDVMGRSVATVLREWRAAGKQEIDVALTRLVSGVFLYVIDDGTSRQAGTLHVVR